VQPYLRAALSFAPPQTEWLAFTDWEGIKLHQAARDVTSASPMQERRDFLPSLSLDEAAIPKAVADAAKIFDQGRVVNNLNQLGYQPRGTQMNTTQTNTQAPGAQTTIVVDESLRGVQMLRDAFVRSGGASPTIITDSAAIVDPKRHLETNPQLAKVLMKFDALHGAALKDEYERIQKAGLVKDGKLVFDAQTTADLVLPRTIARMVLGEVYAQDIVSKLTMFGTMDSARDTIPIMRYRREGANGTLERTYRPTRRQRKDLKRGELQSIARGKTYTDWVNIDAGSRKLSAAISDEFITRARKRPDLISTAKAVQNLVDDVKRNLQQDLFDLQIFAALKYGAVPFTYNATANGADSTIQAVGTTAANAVTIVPDDTTLVVLAGPNVNSLVNVPELGMADSGANLGGNEFFYVPNFSGAKITFVDRAGNPQPPPNTYALRVTGEKAVNEVRFDLTPPSGVEAAKHLNKFLFTITKKAAFHAQDRGYEINFLLASLVVNELIKQAELYASQFRRKGFEADSRPPGEGNEGMVGGYAQWSSKVFPDDFVLLGDTEGALFRIFEPLTLRGPVAGRNQDGQLNGSEEWYTHQEDSMVVPILEKFSIITLYQS